MTALSTTSLIIAHAINNKYNILFISFNSDQFKAKLDICEDNNPYMKRIEKRNRKGEDGVKIDYLKDLEEMHEKWLSNNPGVLVIDGYGETCDMDAIIDYVNKMVFKG